MFIKNAILVENDFRYLSMEYRKGELLTTTNDISTLLLNQKDSKGNKCITPINLGAWSDPFRHDFYDIIRFIFDNQKNISIVKFKKE